MTLTDIFQGRITAAPDDPPPDGLRVSRNITAEDHQLFQRHGARIAALGQSCAIVGMILLFAHIAGLHTVQMIGIYQAEVMMGQPSHVALETAMQENWLFVAVALAAVFFLLKPQAKMFGINVAGWLDYTKIPIDHLRDGINAGPMALRLQAQVLHVRHQYLSVKFFLHELPRARAIGRLVVLPLGGRMFELLFTNSSSEARQVARAINMRRGKAARPCPYPAPAKAEAFDLPKQTADSFLRAEQIRKKEPQESLLGLLFGLAGALVFPVMMGFSFRNHLAAQNYGEAAFAALLIVFFLPAFWEVARGMKKFLTARLRHKCRALYYNKHLNVGPASVHADEHGFTLWHPHRMASYDWAGIDRIVEKPDWLLVYCADALTEILPDTDHMRQALQSAGFLRHDGPWAAASEEGIIWSAKNKG